MKTAALFLMGALKEDCLRVLRDVNENGEAAVVTADRKPGESGRGCTVAAVSGQRPKLIEVALPLAAINAEAAREKSIRHGHPSTLHLWWARRPLAAARAVIWASLVDDPSGDESLTGEEQDAERERLFGILERLVRWENSNDPDVLAAARAEIDRCFPDGPPPVLDPFAGGGSIPLEAQRLGLTALAGDLNPVAVLINKAMIEVPPRFAGRPPVHPDLQGTLGGYSRDAASVAGAHAAAAEEPAAHRHSGELHRHSGELHRHSGELHRHSGESRNPEPPAAGGGDGGAWVRAQGLAADVEAYGRWMREEAQRRIGRLYPAATGPNGEKLTPIAWIWARTVESPDPAWSGHVPLVASWTLANKPGRPRVWIEPIIDRAAQTISYEIRTGGEPTYERTVNRGNGTCIATGAAIPGDYIKAEGRAGRMGQQLMAVVAEGERGRAYCPPSTGGESLATHESPHWRPDAPLPDKGLGFRIQPYGLDEWWKLFTPRQLVALTTFSDLLGEVRRRVLADALAAGWGGGREGSEFSPAAADGSEGASSALGPVGGHRWPSAGASGEIAPPAGPRHPPTSASGSDAVALEEPASSLCHSGERRNPEPPGVAADEAALTAPWPATSTAASDGARLRDGGVGAAAYADAVVTYLAFAVDKCADYWSTICTWATGGFIRGTFGRQAIPMTWDFAECNPFSSSTANWMAMVDWIRKALGHLPASVGGGATQRDARARVREYPSVVISTDPPYYDNVGYGDISDFFFVWLRRNLRSAWPDECATLLTPKSEEIIADSDRHGGPRGAEAHFESGMAKFMAEVGRNGAAEVPATIYYAYKATETRDGEIRTTGWDTFLQAVVDAGLQINATWPMRTEKPGRLRANQSNALASSIVLACRPRPSSAPLATRKEFVAALRGELPEAVRILQSGNIAPVDMAQSTIGPGMRVFSRYAKVLEADGSAMPVSAALAIINDALGEILDGAEAELDAPTRFALTWFSQHGFNAGPAGDADSVARAKDTSLAGVEEAGAGEARSGEFRLYERSELPEDWSPLTDSRLTVWEAVQHLVIALGRSESDASVLLSRLGGYGDRARQLAYLLFTKAGDNGWAAEAGAYNALITAWPTLRSARPAAEAQTLL